MTLFTRNVPAERIVQISINADKAASYKIIGTAIMGH
jgi:hypothetical protein